MPRPRSSAPTQATIAAATGVSIPTVSKALRGDPSISERTRTLVRAAADSLGYTSPAPAPLHEPPTPRPRRRVAVLCDTVDNAYTSVVLGGMLAAARGLDVAVQVDHIGVPADSLGEQAHEITARLTRQAAIQADALILVATPVDKRVLAAPAEFGLPVLAIDPATTPPPGLMTLAASNWRGGVQATEHLLSLGHRRIGVVRGPSTSVPQAERLAGYRSACASAGVVVDEGLIRPGRYDFDSGLAEGGALLDGAAPPTAVFAMSDAVAVGVLEAARTRGLRVPDDLSVVGFDDTPIASLCSPQLTAVRQPLTDIGREAVTVVVRALDQGSAISNPIEMQTSLIVRGSSGPAPRS